MVIIISGSWGMYGGAVMEGEKVKESSITVVQQMTTQDANLAGIVQGGVILKLIDNTADIVAVRHTGTNAGPRQYRR